MVVVKAKPNGHAQVVDTRREKPDLHDTLVRKASTWLRKQGCGVVVTDSIQAITPSGERPDAIGWRDGLSVLIECKASRSDFLADRHKPFRVVPEEGMGDWRFMLCPEGLIAPEELPSGWGLLYLSGQRVCSISGVPTNTEWWAKKPFRGEKHCESILLASALRRYQRVYGRYLLQKGVVLTGR